jgi:Fe-S-cluster containining protein
MIGAMDDLRPPDGPVLRALKAIARAVFVVQVGIARFWQRAPEQDRWRLGGDCQRCAACCERPSIHVDRLTWHLRTFRVPFLWWQRVVNGFELIGRERPRVFVFRCHYFDAAARRCTSYQTRPGICHDYPRLLLDSAWPEFLPGCSYRAVDRNAEQILVALRQAPLTEAQQRALKSRLRVE